MATILPTPNSRQLPIGPADNGANAGLAVSSRPGNARCASLFHEFFMTPASQKLREDALHYHAKGRPGKIEITPTKETENQRDLSLAYSPGVAEPCLAIAENPERAYDYTAKGNLVAVITNGTAVLGLGNIGAVAAKPVMEGKSLLFKIYADIDAFDIELDTTDVDEFIRTVKILEPTFGGVNLEDIRAPECFEIERRLRAELKDRKSTRLNSSHSTLSRMPSSA